MSEDEKIVEQFCVGLRKLFSTRSNWTYVMPLLFNVESCAMCQLCVDECPVYKATREEKLMPVYRSELFRRIVRDCLKGPRSVSSKKDEVYRSIEELYRLSYSCTLCRRCAQACPLGLDNSVITRELRKLFSQELGWAPKELHIDGTCLHLAKGSPTGMSSQILVKEVEFIVEDYSKTFGMELQCTWDMPEADILFIPSIGELFVEPENFISMIILLHIRGEAWTLPSSPPLYDGVNYGVFYDDIQLIRILSAHLKLIKKLKPKALLLSECGHQHRVFLSLAKSLYPELGKVKIWDVPSFVKETVFKHKELFDRQKNWFPVTLHDPCNLAKGLGIVEPQREVLKFLCPNFREMKPSGFYNYCCGGGGGLVLISDERVRELRIKVGKTIKVQQILNAFGDCIESTELKYVCAPCLNCRLQLRDLLIDFRSVKVKVGGLTRLVINALKALPIDIVEDEL